jgi:hypothetical protein
MINILRIPFLTTGGESGMIVYDLMFDHDKLCNLPGCKCRTSDIEWEEGTKEQFLSKAIELLKSKSEQDIRKANSILEVLSLKKAVWTKGKYVLSGLPTETHIRIGGRWHGKIIKVI